VDILVAVWPAVGRGEVFELVVTPLRTCPIRRKKWLEQFRSFWGVAYKRMQVRGVIFPEQETARVFLAGIIFGCKRGPKLEGRNVLFLYSRAQISSPKNGLQFGASSFQPE
jgi:hypothetical protein